MKSQDTQISNYIESRLTRVETVIEHINQNLKEIKSDMKDMKTDMKYLESKITSQFYWIISAILLPSGSASFIYILKSLHFIS